MSIPLHSFVNTADDFIIKDLDTQEKDVLNKKNTLKYKAVLSPMFYKGEDKVYTTSGHTITKTNNQTLTDENGRTYAVDNSFVIDRVADISNLWSGELTSAITKDGKIYSVWKGERDYTIVVSDFDNKILASKTYAVNAANLLYYNVKLANYTRDASKADTTIYLARQEVTTYPISVIAVETIDENADRFAVWSNTFAYATGRDLYVLCYRRSGTNYVAVGTDDTDLRKRFTFENNALKYKYWGCLGSNGLLTGEPVLTTINSRGTAALSSKTIAQDDFSYLSNGIGYGQQISSGTDAQDISANGSLGTDTLGNQNGATTWGGIGHSRYGTKAFVAGIDLESGIPLILSPSYVNTVPQNGDIKSNIYSLDAAQYVGYTVPDGDSVAIEQVDFSDAWGNVTWNNGTASITNGCNPFPYKYVIMNRAESKGRYWDYGPGWARCYFRQGIIKSFDGNGWHRAFAEQYPTSIISFGLSSLNGKNAVRQEYLDPVTLVDAAGATQADTVSGWAHGSVHTTWYYKYHNIRDTNSHIWVNFLGADNLAEHTILLKIPFNVDICPALNIKEQYFDGVYMSTSMNGTLLTSASVHKKADSMLFIESVTDAGMYSNGLVLKGKANGEVQLTKVADYIYKTNTLTGNNLFIDSKESFYGQRGFIPYNGEELITLHEMTGMLSPGDDGANADGNDTYYSAAGYNENMTDMKNRGVSYLLPAIVIPMTVDGNQTENFTYQLNSNKKEITMPLLYNQFTYKDKFGVDHFYTHSRDKTSIEYQTTKVMESNASGDVVYFGVSTYDNDKTGQVWYITSEVFYYPMGIASIVTGINYLASSIDMTDDYTVRLYRTQNVTFPVYNPSTEVYKGSTIFTIYGYNYSFDGQSIYYLGSGDQTTESSFACYALGMQFLANSGTEAYFYSPFEKRLYLFTGSNTLQISDSLSREGKIIDSIYSSCEQILYLLTEDGNVIAKSQNDMAVLENIDTSYHFEGTDSGMILAKGFSYKKYRLYQTDETEWLPIEFETEYLGKNNSIFKTAIAAITFFNYNDKTIEGKVYWDCMHDNMPKRTYRPFKITAKDWEPTKLKKLEFAAPGNVGKAFRFGIESNDYISIADVMLNMEEVSQNTNAPKHI